MDQEILSTFNRLIEEHGLSPNEALSVSEGGRLLDDVLTERAQREKAAKLAKRKNAEWPRPRLVWDLEFAHWHLSMDDHDQISFAEAFSAVEIVWVHLSSLYDRLADGSRRTKDPFHSSYRSKTARLVVHLEGGGRVSPPMIILDEDQVRVVGGNHRLGWAHLLNEDILPILIRGSDRSILESLVGFCDHSE